MGGRLGEWVGERMGMRVGERGPKAEGVVEVLRMGKRMGPARVPYAPTFLDVRSWARPVMSAGTD